jgi:hypothetical protein
MKRLPFPYSPNGDWDTECLENFHRTQWRLEWRIKKSLPKRRTFKVHIKAWNIMTPDTEDKKQEISIRIHFNRGYFSFSVRKKKRNGRYQWVQEKNYCSAASIIEKEINFLWRLNHIVKGSRQDCGESPLSVANAGSWMFLKWKSPRLKKFLERARDLREMRAAMTVEKTRPVRHLNCAQKGERITCARRAREWRVRRRRIAEVDEKREFDRQMWEAVGPVLIGHKTRHPRGW